MSMSREEIRRLPSGVRYEPHARLGLMLPLILSYDKLGVPQEFYISELTYSALNPGVKNECVGKTPWGPWCELVVKDHQILHVSVIRDRERLQELDREHKEFDQMQRDLNRMLIGRSVLWAGEELFFFQGFERYWQILKTPTAELDRCCNQYLVCAVCPLAIRYEDANKETHYLCAVEASEERIKRTLKNGGYFNRREGSK